MRLFQTLLFLTFLLSGCGASPAPEPTPTPIPGYVAGEEKFAYDSFIEYYKIEIVDCNWSDLIEYDLDTGIDEEYPGVAVYVGDAIWRFHIQTWQAIFKRGEDTEYDYKEEVIEVRSFPDRTWENICNRRAPGDDYDDRYDHIMPDGPEEDEPLEESPWDGILGR